MKLYVVSAHIGDPFWISQMLSTLTACAGEHLFKVLVLNQDGTDLAHLQQTFCATEVRAGIIDADQEALLGHSHPANLDFGMTLAMQTDCTHVLVVDSDVVFYGRDWLQTGSGSVLVADPGSSHALTHPCFALLDRATMQAVSFSDGVRDGFDTGRLLGSQLAEAGLPHVIGDPSRVAGWRGDFYFRESLYHHGSASFRFGTRTVQYADTAFEYRLSKALLRRGTIRLRWPAAWLARSARLWSRVVRRRRVIGRILRDGRGSPTMRPHACRRGHQQRRPEPPAVTP